MAARVLARNGHSGLCAACGGLKMAGGGRTSPEASRWRSEKFGAKSVRNPDSHGSRRELLHTRQQSITMLGLLCSNASLITLSPLVRARSLPPGYQATTGCTYFIPLHPTHTSVSSSISMSCLLPISVLNRLVIQAIRGDWCSSCFSTCVSRLKAANQRASMDHTSIQSTSTVQQQGSRRRYRSDGVPLIGYHYR